MEQNSHSYSVARSTVQESIYQQLYNSIVNLELKPGELISTSDVADKLCASRTPVREAFLTLKTEGLLDISPQRPTVVSRIDLERVHQERFVREALELKNIKIFAANVKEEDITNLKSIMKKMKMMMNAEDTVGMIRTDNQFHEYILHASGEFLSESIIKRMNGHYSRIRLISLQESGIRRDVCSEHNEIIVALENGNPDKAYELLEKHLNVIDTQEVNLISKWPDFFTNM